MDDLKLCYDALGDKSRRLLKLGRYYAGQHPIAFQN